MDLNTTMTSDLFCAIDNRLLWLHINTESCKTCLLPDGITRGSILFCGQLILRPTYSQTVSNTTGRTSRNKDILIMSKLFWTFWRLERKLYRKFDTVSKSLGLETLVLGDINNFDWSKQYCYYREPSCKWPISTEKCYFICFHRETSVEGIVRPGRGGVYIPEAFFQLLSRSQKNISIWSNWKGNSVNGFLLCGDFVMYDDVGAAVSMTNKVDKSMNPPHFLIHFGQQAHNSAASTLISTQNEICNIGEFRQRV